jgi:hypothetical protein
MTDSESVALPLGDSRLPVISAPLGIPDSSTLFRFRDVISSDSLRRFLLVHLEFNDAWRLPITCDFRSFGDPVYIASLDYGTPADSDALPH